ncbi:hypothetical protein ACFCXA_15820 [Streptomyces virginiae]|uniref:hypothetical protein n=1 Tax=Streptomyces virginiae TaxID=1961 RepID=UPI0035DCA5BD
MIRAKGEVLQKGLSLLLGGAMDIVLIVVENQTWEQALWRTLVTVGALNAVVIISEKVRVDVS